MAAGRHRGGRAWAAVTAFSAFTLLAALAVETATAAFPGKPGPIVYRKTFDRKLDSREGFETTGGLFLRGPRLGEAPRQLTFDASDHDPSFDPRGRRVIFASHSERFVYDVYTIDRDGSDRRLLVENGRQPAFYPDSRRIVFKRGNWIFSIRIDGTGLRPITSSPFPDHEPIVSPDGRKIAFVRTRGGNEDIFLVGAKGGRSRPLVELPKDDDDPEWAPDGRRIVFAGSRRGCGTGIYVVRAADGSGIRRLTPCERSGEYTYNHPAFSPDGRHVIALRHGGGTIALVLIRADAGGIVGIIDRGHRREDGVWAGVDTASWGPLAG